MPDGSIATVRSMSFNDGEGREVLIPTISDDGRLLSDDDAIALYRQSGRHLGIFATPDDATAYAKQLSQQQGRDYGANTGGWQMPSFDDLMPKQSLPAALGNTAMSGIIGSVGLGVATPSRMIQAADRGYANTMLRAVETLASDEGAAYRALTPVQRGVLTAYRHATPERQAELQAEWQSALTQGTPAMVERGAAISQYGRDKFPVDPAQQGDLTNAVGMIASLPVALGAGALGALAGGPAGGFAGMTSVIYAQAYESTYQEAIEKGATPEKAAEVASKNAGAQSVLNFVPLARVIGRIPARFRDEFIKTVVKYGQSSLEFGTANALGRFIKNFIYQKEIDPKQSLTEGVWGDTKAGLLVGPFMLGSAAAGRGAGSVVRNQLGQAASPEFRADLNQTERLAAKAQPTIAPEAVPVDGLPPWLQPREVAPGGEPSTPAQGSMPLPFNPDMPTKRITPEPGDVVPVRPEAAPDRVPEGPVQDALPADLGRPADDVAPAPDAVFPEPVEAAPLPPMGDPKRPPKPPSLFDFLISKGGIRPDGDLIALGLDTVHHQRAGRLLNNKGAKADMAREAAVEAGYLPPDATLADFYNALAEENTGRPVYPPEYATEVGQWKDGQAADRERIRGEELAAEARAAAEESGVRLTPDEEMHAARLMAEGARPEEAVYEAVRASDIERGQAYDEARGMLSAREKGQADQRAQGAPSPEAGRARQELAVVMQRLMRLAGLPSSVGLKLVDRLVDAEGNAADGAYTRSLVTYALDTPAPEAPTKLFHEVTHALMDPELGVLTPTQRNALMRAADKWLTEPGRRQELTDLGYTPEQMREEAVARVAEEVVAKARREAPITTRAVEAMNRAVEAIGSGLRGQGFWSADGVFRAVMQGRVKGDGKGGADGSPQYARRPLPEGLDPRLPASGGLSEGVEKRNVGILSPEATANAARYTSPEGREYGALLDAQRQAWGRVDWLRPIVEDSKAQLREPGLTDRGAERKYGTLQRAQARLADAEASALALGLAPDAAFPRDVRMDVPFGEFPGDNKYAHETYAPEGYPFPDLNVPEDKRHQYHDPRHRVRQDDTPAGGSPQYARRPGSPVRRRGAEAIISRLNLEANKRRAEADRGNGPRVHPDEIREVDDFIRFVGEDLVRDVGLHVRVGDRPEQLGQFNSADRIVTVFESALRSGNMSNTMVHELWHSLERLVPLDQRRALGREFVRAKERWVREHDWARPFDQPSGLTRLVVGPEADAWLVRNLGNEEAMSSVRLEKLPTGGNQLSLAATRDSYRFTNRSEYFAESLTDRFYDHQWLPDEKARSVVGHFRGLWQRIKDAFKRIWGDGATAQTFGAFERGDFQRATPDDANPFMAYDPRYSRRPPKPPPSGPDLFGGGRREPEQRAAVPTFRTDPRQEAMPGMEPSAVQAQAARDQTGRGGLEPRVPQARPDEGLFGREAPEEGALLSRRRPKGDADETPQPDLPGSGRPAPVGQNSPQPRPAAGQGKLDASRSAWEIEDPSMVDRFLRTYVNKTVDMDAVQKSIEKAYGSIPDSRNASLKETNYHGKVAARVLSLHEKHVEPILQKIADNREGVTIDDVDRYLLARHAPERNAAMKAINPDRVDNEALSGMSDADAAAAMQAFAGESKLSRLEDIAKDVDKLTADTRKVIKAEGLETADTIKAWEDAYQFYAPLQRDIEGNGAPKGSGFNVRGPESKRSMGSTLEVKNILANIVAQAETAAIRAEKNKVTTALADLAKQYPADGFWKVDEVPTTRQINKSTGLVETIPDPLYQLADNVVMYKEGGKHHFIKFDEKNKRAMEVARGIKNMDPAQRGLFSQMLGWPARFMSQLLTRWNPEFWETNFIRDIGGAQFNLAGTDMKGGRWEMTRNIGRAMKGLHNLSRGDGKSEWARYAKEMDAAGGTTGYMEMYETSDKRMNNLKSEVAKLQQGKADPRRLARATLEMVDDYNSIVENSVRLAAFQAARKQGLSTEKAARVAKNITVNFNRKGNLSPLLNDWFMFFNASVQGTSSIVKAAAKSPKARAALGAMAATGFLLDMVNREVIEDYDALPDFEKQHNFIFQLGSGPPVKLPYPPGLNSVFNVGRLLSEWSSGRSHKEPIEYAASMAMAMLDAFNPMGSVGSVGQFVAPSAFRWLVQLLENTSFTGAPVFKSGDRGVRGDDPKPAHRRHFQNTPEMWISASKGLNALTGGDYVEKGAINVSPDALRHIFTSLTGGPGRMVDRTVDYLTSDEPSAARLPFVGRLVRPIDERDRERFFMSESRIINTAINEVDHLLKSGRPDAADRVIKDLGKGNLNEGFRILGVYRAAKVELDRLRRQNGKMAMQEPNDETTAIGRMMRDMTRQSMGRARREGQPP
tara:strand:+ start:1125 stop:8195 length:7071 start_codon:yes stop_codon:yes gene_type:complete